MTSFAVAEVDRDLKFWKNIFLNVERQFSSVRWRFAFAYQSTQMIGAQVYLVGEREFHRRDSELVSPRGFLEHFVATRVFHFKHQPAVADRLMIGAVKGQRARVNYL